MSVSKKTKNKNRQVVFSKLITFIGFFLLFSISIYFGRQINILLRKNVSVLSLSPLRDAKKVDQLCKNSTDKDRCYGSEFYQITKKNDLKYAIDVLTYLQKIDPQNTNGCHFISHKISQAQTEKDPSRWREVIKRVSPSNCTGGFLHGVIEAHMATDPNFTINEDSFKKICDDVYAKHRTWFAWRGCVHNMGHLILVEQDGNIQNAVTACDKINNSGTQYECLSGAFMEKITGENLLAHGLLDHIPSWDERLSKNTEELCKNYSGTSARACWKVISYVYFATSNHDPVGLYEKCQRAPESSMRDECFIYGAGNLVVTTRFDRSNLRGVCHQFDFDNPLFAPCMSQTMGALLTSTTENISLVSDLCNKTYDNFKKTCFVELIEILAHNQTRPEIIDSTCSLVPKDFKPQVCKASK